jgi:hypothetical protein
MKLVRPAIVFLGSALLMGCETTPSTSGGTQETKHRAALEQQRRQPPVDEARANLWGAHEDILDRDSNPLRAY